MADGLKITENTSRLINRIYVFFKMATDSYEVVVTSDLYLYVASVNKT